MLGLPNAEKVHFFIFILNAKASPGFSKLHTNSHKLNNSDNTMAEVLSFFFTCFSEFVHTHQCGQ